ncbi:phage tail protein [uncultured Clostridium sp.]|jgi:gas vesicle protein|uniref:phage tail protein n=1 Tax=uncultured Clostridium sp. TaxID=59620 RepID=UPI00260C295A|nr:phage tail protein [uncultured Clostridium sp.]
MFKIKIKGTTEELKCLNKNIKFTKNTASLLTFELAINSPKYNKLKKYLDYIQVIDERTNTLIFNGRVMSNSMSMTNTGEFTNTVVCESVLNYLNDTYVGVWEFHPLDLPAKAPKGAIANATVSTFLTKLLDNHNSKVGKEKQILLGNIEINEPVYIKTNYESSLEGLISKVLDRHNGYLIIRCENGINYLDYLLNSPITNVQTVELGSNMESIDVDDSDINIFTRVIPFGKNNIGINSVNNDIEYVQDDNLVAKYGVIEKVMKWDDVTIPQNLLNKAKAVFSQVKLNADSIKLTALDLSYIDNSFDELKLYMPIRVINEALEYDNIHEIVSILLDLENPFKSTFDLNQSAITSNDNVSSAIAQINSNKIEIVSIGSELETKVSGDNFETYRIQSNEKIQDTVKTLNNSISTVKTQTATKIQNSVKDLNKNISSMKTQLSSEISDKISSKDMSSELKQQLNEFDFTIGGNTPLKITQEELDCKFKDGSETIIGEDGFYYKSGDGKFDYHCLYYHDSVSKVHSGENRTITVPEIFRGKDYKIAYWLGNVFSENPTDCLNSYDVELLSNDKDSMTFTIKVSIMSFNPRTETSPSWRGYGNIVYTILA